jgi:hypothetical protein
MFTIPRGNVIQSSDGYSVEVLGHVGLLYTEGSKSIHVNSEISLGPSGLGIYKGSIRAWNPPYDNETIDDNKRDTIVENIRRAFRFQGFEIEVI